MDIESEITARTIFEVIRADTEVVGECAYRGIGKNAGLPQGALHIPAIAI